MAAVFLAFVVALAGFTGVCITAPVGYPEDALWEKGLVKEIVFDEEVYHSPCFVRGQLTLINPSDVDVVVDLENPINWYVFSETTNPWVAFSVYETISVTVPARGEYRASFFSFQAEGPGYYEVNWGGFRRGVNVDVGELIPRLVAEKSVYEDGENGYLTFEYYNPKPYPVNLTRPSKVMLELWIDGVDQQTGLVSFIDYIDPNVTVQPGESAKIMTFYFTTYKPGCVTYSGMGASRTILVLPYDGG